MYMNVTISRATFECMQLWITRTSVDSQSTKQGKASVGKYVKVGKEKPHSYMSCIAYPSCV